MASWRVQFGVFAQMEALMDGISTLIPVEALEDFSEKEIELLINGKKEVDVDEIRAYAIFQVGSVGMDPLGWTVGMDSLLFRWAKVAPSYLKFERYHWHC